MLACYRLQTCTQWEGCENDLGSEADHTGGCAIGGKLLAH